MDARTQWNAFNASLVYKILQIETYQINVNVKMAFFRMEMNVNVNFFLSFILFFIKIYQNNKFFFLIILYKACAPKCETCISETVCTNCKSSLYNNSLRNSFNSCEC
jgi:hypothetical protein